MLKTTTKGITVIFDEGGRKVLFKKQGHTIMDGTRNNMLHKLNSCSIKTAETSAVNVVITEDLMTWHERLGHVNLKMLRKMSQEKTVEDLNIKSVQDDDRSFLRGMYIC